MTLRPELGGLVASLAHDGVPVLRPLVGERPDAADAACFPLVPYANRIAHGRFLLHGREHRLPLNFRAEPHSLHGIGWQSAWQVQTSAADQATMSFRHVGGDGWPWRFHAQQHFVLAATGLTIDLSVTNEDGEPMPAGLGLHPYFLCTIETQLSFTASGLWQVGGTLLPTEVGDVDSLGDWANGAPVHGDTLIDNAYFGWSGTARIDHGDGRAYRLSASGAPWLQLFRPSAGAGFFCIEPANHGPDAINRIGMPLLEPGKTQRMTMRITAD